MRIVRGTLPTCRVDGHSGYDEVSIARGERSFVGRCGVCVRAAWGGDDSFAAGVTQADLDLRLLYTITSPNGEKIFQLEGGTQLLDQTGQKPLLGPDKKPIRGVGAAGNRFANSSALISSHRAGCRHGWGSDRKKSVM